jgi:hypothetical protein
MTRWIRFFACHGVAVALLFCAAPALADGVPATSLPQWITQAQQRLGLQIGQQRQLRALVDENSERLRELRESHSPLDGSEARRAQREAMASLQVEFRGRLVGILTPGQLIEWDSLVEELLGEIHLRNAPRVAELAR